MLRRYVAAGRLERSRHEPHNAYGISAGLGGTNCTLLYTSVTWSNSDGRLDGSFFPEDDEKIVTEKKVRRAFGAAFTLPVVRMEREQDGLRGACERKAAQSRVGNVHAQAGHGDTFDREVRGWNGRVHPP